MEDENNDCLNEEGTLEYSYLTYILGIYIFIFVFINLSSYLFIIIEYELI